MLIIAIIFYLMEEDKHDKLKAYTSLIQNLIAGKLKNIKYAQEKIFLNKSMRLIWP